MEEKRKRHRSRSVDYEKKTRRDKSRSVDKKRHSRSISLDPKKKHKRRQSSSDERSRTAERTLDKSRKPHREHKDSSRTKEEKYRAKSRSAEKKRNKSSSVEKKRRKSSSVEKKRNRSSSVEKKRNKSRSVERKRNRNRSPDMSPRKRSDSPRDRSESPEKVYKKRSSERHTKRRSRSVDKRKRDKSSSLERHSRKKTRSPIDETRFSIERLNKPQRKSSESPKSPSADRVEIKYSKMKSSRSNSRARSHDRRSRSVDKNKPKTRDLSPFPAKETRTKRSRTPKKFVASPTNRSTSQSNRISEEGKLRDLEELALRNSILAKLGKSIDESSSSQKNRTDLMSPHRGETKRKDSREKSPVIKEISCRQEPPKRISEEKHRFSKSPKRHNSKSSTPEPIKQKKTGEKSRNKKPLPVVRLRASSSEGENYASDHEKEEVFDDKELRILRLLKSDLAAKAKESLERKKEKPPSPKPIVKRNIEPDLFDIKVIPLNADKVPMVVNDSSSKRAMSTSKSRSRSKSVLSKNRTSKSRSRSSSGSSSR